MAREEHMTPTDDTLALDALARMDDQEYRDARRFFDYCLQNIYYENEETAAVLASCGWHLILRAYHAEIARRGGQA
jgi:hypothetical protein